MKAEDIKVGMRVKLDYAGYKGCDRHIRQWLDTQKYVVTVKSISKGGWFYFITGMDKVVMHVDHAEPYQEPYVCNIPGVTVDLIPGKKYWISDVSEEAAIEYKFERIYVCTVGSRHLFVGQDYISPRNYPNKEFTITPWKYAVDPDTYKERETELTVEQIADILRSNGLIDGKLKIKGGIWAS